MATKNDGTLPFGSRTLVIPVTTGDTFVAERIDITKGGSFNGQYDEDGVPSGGVDTDEFEEGSATLQIPTGAITLPVRGDVFLTPDSAGASTSYYVTSVGTPEENQGIQKCEISFRKKYNA